MTEKNITSMGNRLFFIRFFSCLKFWVRGGLSLEPELSLSLEVKYQTLRAQKPFFNNKYF